MDEPFLAVAKVLAVYFDGLYEGDTTRLAAVFHPEARYASATGGELINLGMDAYFPMVETRPSPASRGEIRRDEIVSIEFAGPAAAFARVRCAIAAKHFTDLLTLIRVDGDWRIISKVFHYDLESRGGVDVTAP